MSGPKRGTWRIRTPYDPTEVPLRDLRGYCMKIDRWIEDHRGFLFCHLGEVGIAQAEAARDRVLERLEDRDPDGGFTCYGSAWTKLNGLWGMASAACEEERLRRAREEARRREELRERARASIEVCKGMWNDRANRRLLSLWAEAADIETLSRRLEGLDSGRAGTVLKKAEDWQELFRIVLESAREKARRNSEEVRLFLPRVRRAVAALDELDTSFLPDEEKKQASRRSLSLKAEVESAVTEEDLPGLTKIEKGIAAFVGELGQKVEAARLRNAAERWKNALQEAGYLVSAKLDQEGGSVVLDATAFPMKSVRVSLQRGSDEVQLHMNGESDGPARVGDIGSLSDALKRQDIEFHMTHWGWVDPAGLPVHQSLEQKVIDHG